MQKKDLSDTIFFYVEGSDLHGVAPLLRTRFEAVVDGREWVTSNVWLVDQIREDVR